MLRTIDKEKRSYGFMEQGKKKLWIYGLLSRQQNSSLLIAEAAARSGRSVRAIQTSCSTHQSCRKATSQNAGARKTCLSRHVEEGSDYTGCEDKRERENVGKVWQKCVCVKSESKCSRG